MIFRTVNCPKCRKLFQAVFKARQRKVVNTPCCGWLGKGPAPVWACKPSLRGGASKQSGRLSDVSDLDPVSTLQGIAGSSARPFWRNR